MYVDRAVAGKLLQQVASPQTRAATALTYKLTEREVMVLWLVAHGLNNAEIAAELHHGLGKA